jgi:hypothetical protein
MPIRVPTVKKGPEFGFFVFWSVVFLIAVVRTVIIIMKGFDAVFVSYFSVLF